MSLLKPEDGKRVLDFIKKNLNHKLPKSGLLAGQSITSILLYLLGKSDKVEINDYDIFMPVGRKNNNWKWDFRPETWTEYRNEPIAQILRISESISMTQVKAASHILGLEKDTDYNGNLIHEKGSISKQKYRNNNYLVFDAQTKNVYGYKIDGVFRKGLLNYVFVNASLHDFLTPDPWEVINHFDINCTQVAINLKTGRLYYTRYFEHFLHSKQMLIVNCARPDHTFLRFVQKIEQHGYYGNVDLAAQMCSTYVKVCEDPDVINEFYEQEPIINPYHGELARSKKITKFGGGYLNKYKDSSMVNDFARLELHAAKTGSMKHGSHDYVNSMIFALGGTHNVAIDNLVHLGKLDYRVDDFDFILKGNHKALLEKSSGLTVSGYINYVRGAVPSILNDYYGSFKKKLITRRFDLLDSMRLNTKNNLDNIGAATLLYDNSDVFHGNPDLSRAKEIKKLVHDHPNLEALFRHHTIDEQNKLSKILKALDKRHPEFLHMVEAKGYFDWKDKSQKEVYDHLEVLYKDYEEELKKQGQLKEEPDFETQEIDGVKIIELISQSMLDDESHVLRHCVRSYGYAVKGRRSYILSFRKGSSLRATLELRKKGEKWDEIQFRTTRNRKPDKELIEVKDKFLRKINRLDDPEESEEKN